jgi:hypothetical protein
LHDSLHIDVQGLQLLPNLGFGHALAYVFQQQAHASILRERKGVKTHNLALIEGPPIVARKPSAVSGTSIRISPFIWATRLLPDFARIHSRNLRVFFT